MSQEQREAVEVLLRSGLLDIGGEAPEQRVIFERMLAARRRTAPSPTRAPRAPSRRYSPSSRVSRPTAGLRVPVSATYPLSEIRQAFAEPEQGHTLGKIVPTF